MTSVRHVRVEQGESGQRIDNFLLRRAPGVPKSHVYKLIRSGQVRVDGGRVKPTRKLVAGEQVRIPPMRTAVRERVRVPDALAEAVATAVVVENEDYLVLDKPAGLAVHAGSGLAFGAIDALRQAREEPSLELVHRLDRGTSGALLIARDAGRSRALQALFRERTVDKTYRAIVVGAWPDHISRVDLPLSSNVEHAGERRVVVTPDGQTALSVFTRERSYGALASEVSVAIETGRTHQIRVHAMASGCPIVGDERYGDNRANTQFKRLGLARLCLHSTRIGFEWHGTRHEIDVPPDAPWEAMRRALVGAPAGGDAPPGARRVR